jgi:phenylalanyl-tRNA synthetase beta subunit
VAQKFVLVDRLGVMRFKLTVENDLLDVARHYLLPDITSELDVYEMVMIYRQRHQID